MKSLCHVTSLGAWPILRGTMEEIIKGLTEKVGLDQETAEKVVAFLMEHKDQLPALLAKSGLEDKLPESIKGKIPGGFGGLLG